MSVRNNNAPASSQKQSYPTVAASSVYLYQNPMEHAHSTHEAPMHPVESRVPYQDDFYLLDVVGGQNISAMHPSKPIVAYTAGCMIIVYDLISDAKI